jgi:hypothetical protein
MAIALHTLGALALILFLMVAFPTAVWAFLRLRQRLQQRREARLQRERWERLVRAAAHSQAELDRVRQDIGWTFERRSWWE